MPNQLINTPEAFEAAIEHTLQVRRDNLLRAARTQRIRTGVALGLAACIALFALAAFVAGDREAAAVIASMAGLTFGFTYVAGRAGGKKAADSLLKMDHST